MARLITRRRALFGLGGLAGAGVLGAAGFFAEDRYSRFIRGAEFSIRDHRVDVPATTPRMVITHGLDPAKNVRAVIEKLGGMSRYVTSEDVVVIKPNIGWDRSSETGANTHPDVVAEVVRQVKEARPKRVIVADCPVRKSRAAFVRSGIQAAAVAAGAEIFAPEDIRHVVVKVSDRLGTWDVLEPFVQATKIINVPVAKHHPLTGVTAGLKNWMGITGKLRVMLHEDIERAIAELAALMTPTLTIVDATRLLMQGGPDGGNPVDVKPMGVMAAGFDPVALDAWAFSLFPGVQLPQNLHLAQEMGLGRIDFAALSPVEVGQ
ncbi:MAG TPA: DUF362 domain-containing protein [Myxococcales bacterium]|jgi:uncharacterized protein (DUF362 family)